MKTLNPRTIIAAVAILATASFANAQVPVHACTIVEVTDGYYSDKVWMITEPGTTDGFDNGWDGYKFLSTATYVPQIFDNTAGGKFQVSSFPTIENNSFAFIPGSATEYTMTFTHYDVAYFYPGLYLVDLQTGDTVDVYANLSTYKFSAAKTDMVDRFKFITKLPQAPVVVVPPVVEPPVVVVPPVVEPPVVVVPPVVEPPVVVVPPVVEPPVVVVPPVVVPNEGSVTDPGVDPGSSDVIGDTTKDKKDKKDKKNKAKDVKIKANKKKIHVDNPNKTKAKIRVIEARTGKLVKEVIVNPSTTTTVDTNVNTGQYVIQTSVDTDYTSTTVLLQ